MKHYLYSPVSARSNFQIFNNIKKILKANIKTTWTYPKTIWYSMRYNSGEKFILQDKSLYPYNYDCGIYQEKDSVGLSTQLLCSIRDHKYYHYLRKTNEKNKQFLDIKEIKKNYNNSFEELVLGYKYNSERSEKEFSMPCAVSARVLYGFTLSSASENHKLEKSILSHFFKKIEYADAESIAQVMYLLAHYNYFKPEVWGKLIEALRGKHFQPEFTAVASTLPHLFRYKEVKKQGLSFLDSFGNSLFAEGYLHAFEAYHALSKAQASGQGVDAADLISDLEKRIPLLKSKYEDFQKFIITK